MTQNIRWHGNEKKYDGKICHITDSLQWKKIDSLVPYFGHEQRNIRLGLGIDGMNPFGT